MGCEHGPRELYVADPPTGWPLSPYLGMAQNLDMLLEAAFVVEDLVAEVAVFLLPVEQEPEEKAIDPAHKALAGRCWGAGQRGPDHQIIGGG